MFATLKRDISIDFWEMISWVEIEDEPNNFKPSFQIILMKKVNNEDVREEEFHHNWHQEEAIGESIAVFGIWTDCTQEKACYLDRHAE